MKEELNRCLLCARPACTGCPAGSPVAAAIRLVREGKFDEAGRLLFENNPLSSITGAICPNHRFCMQSCVLARKGKGVNFSKIECEISKEFIKNADGREFAPSAENGRKVLIIGGGPAGLALAFYLRRAGFAVTVAERDAKFGGMLRYGIPNVRLDKSLIDNIVRTLLEMGIIFLANKNIDVNALPRGEFDIFVYAGGAGLSNKIGVEGEDLPHVVGAIEYLRDAKPQKKVVIIGGGNVAVDCAIAARVTGADATVCYRRGRGDMKANPDEIELAAGLGAEFKFHMIPKRIVQNGIIFGDGNFHAADLIIAAVGQRAETVNTKDLFIIGDAALGTTTVIEAVASAKKLCEQLISEKRIL